MRTLQKMSLLEFIRYSGKAKLLIPSSQMACSNKDLDHFPFSATFLYLTEMMLVPIVQGACNSFYAVFSDTLDPLVRTCKRLRYAWTLMTLEKDEKRRKEKP